MKSARTLILLLTLLCAAQQARLIAQAPLAAQDAVEFVAVAQRIQAEGLAPTIRSEPVAPLFPYSVYLTHTALTSLRLLDAAAWGRAAQIAAAVSAILAVVPIFLFARRLAGRDAALVAGILYCLLPATSRLGADGTSDALHLCLAAFALWSFCEACQVFERLETKLRRALAWSFTAGTFAGAALLCRAEILMFLPAVALIGLFGLSRPRRPRPLLSSYVLASCFALGFSASIVPYVAAGVFAPAEIAERLQGGGSASTDRPLNAPLAAWESEQNVDVRPPGELLVRDGAILEFGRKDRTRSLRTLEVGAASRLYLHEFLQACGYVVSPLALVGLWALGTRLGSRPWMFLWFFVTFYLVMSCAWVLMVGYVTSRHFLLPVVAMLPAAGLGLMSVAERLRVRFAANRSTTRAVHALTGALAIGCLAATLQPPHHTHAAHRRAADWLRSPAAADGFVLDQQGWTALSTGRPTYRFDEAETALTDPRLRYVLVERIDLEAPSRRGKSLRAVLGSADRATECFADVRGRSRHDVLLFARTPNDAFALRNPSPPQDSPLVARRKSSDAR